MDWGRSKMDRIVKNEEQLEQLKNYLRSIYKYFREMYKYMAGVDPMKDLPCIGTNAFSDLCSNGLPTLIDGRMLALKDLDLERIQTNANDIQAKFNPKEKLIRHNFLEVFVRICMTKYLKNGAGEGNKVPVECMKMMFDRELAPYFKKFDSHDWRKKFCWQEDIDLVLK